MQHDNDEQDFFLFHHDVLCCCTLVWIVILNEYEDKLRVGKVISQ